jgi:hypothetical protein
LSSLPLSVRYAPSPAPRGDGARFDRSA